MSKKTKRKVTTVINSSPSQQAMSVETVGTPVKTTSTYRRPSSSVEFNPDYSYVIKDLKRIGILAGSFFAILIVLAFIL